MDGWRRVFILGIAVGLTSCSDPAASGEDPRPSFSLAATAPGGDTVSIEGTVFILPVQVAAYSETNDGSGARDVTLSC